MIKKEQSWDLMITLNKEDYPVIVKAKPDGGFKVHYISLIVIFHVLAESLAFVDQMHNLAHVFLWLAVAFLEFLWLYCTVGELSILSGGLSKLQENVQASSEAVKDGPSHSEHLLSRAAVTCPLVTPPKEELARRLWLYKPWMPFVRNVTVACVTDGRLSYKRL